MGRPELFQPALAFLVCEMVFLSHSKKVHLCLDGLLCSPCTHFSSFPTHHQEKTVVPTHVRCVSFVTTTIFLSVRLYSGHVVSLFFRYVCVFCFFLFACEDQARRYTRFRTRTVVLSFLQSFIHFACVPCFLQHVSLLK